MRRYASDICRAGDDGDLTVDELVAALLRRLEELVVESQRAIEVVEELAGDWSRKRQGLLGDLPLLGQPRQPPGSAPVAGAVEVSVAMTRAPQGESPEGAGGQRLEKRGRVLSFCGKSPR